MIFSMIVARHEVPGIMRKKPRPPMVCVKLPRSVLVVFHLFRATELPNFQGLKS